MAISTGSVGLAGAVALDVATFAGGGGVVVTVVEGAASEGRGVNDVEIPNSNVAMMVATSFCSLLPLFPAARLVESCLGC